MFGGMVMAITTGVTTGKGAAGAVGAPDGAEAAGFALGAILRDAMTRTTVKWLIKARRQVFSRWGFFFTALKLQGWPNPCFLALGLFVAVWLIHPPIFSRTHSSSLVLQQGTHARAVSGIYLSRLTHYLLMRTFAIMQ
jgi:hypothetical protein